MSTNHKHISMNIDQFTCNECLTHNSGTRRGSSVGSVSASYASCPEIDPPANSFMENFSPDLSVTGKRMGTKNW